MKKSSKILALLLVVCVAASFMLTGCGKKDVSAINKQIEAYIGEAKDEIDSMADLFGDLMNMKVFARDGSFVYSFQYTMDLGASNKELKKTLDASMDALQSTYKGLYSDMQKDIPDIVSICVEYLDVDGNMITSREFK